MEEFKLHAKAKMVLMKAQSEYERISHSEYIKDVIMNILNTYNGAVLTIYPVS
eukprot:CAMPEP_0116893890 /NCGR_PEP_ID=MMETSP0467-20121206/3785_1 /TAXON_ID=283647 /ORGANISM="Mesodinium pulex, Strain SPMC105" /LENGTH=52 /DNA_ID=CAMNT_0004563815 /DNA_START=1194 /DNA_END=1352 /DNA_ORIENTATION=+